MGGKKSSALEIVVRFRRLTMDYQFFVIGNIATLYARNCDLFNKIVISNPNIIISQRL